MTTKDIPGITLRKDGLKARLESAGLEYQLKAYPKFFDMFADKIAEHEANLGKLRITAIDMVTAWNNTKSSLQIEHIVSRGPLSNYFDDKIFERVVDAIIKEPYVREQAKEMMYQYVLRRSGSANP